MRHRRQTAAWLEGRGRNRLANVRRGIGRKGQPAEVVQTARRQAQAATVSDRASLARGRGGLAVALLALAGFAVLFTLVRTKRSAAADVAITMRLQRRKWPWLGRVMHLASWPGFPPQSRIIPAVLPAVIWTLGFRLEALFQLLGWGTSGLSFCIKSIMNRERPNQPEIAVAVARIGGSSFPSGHTINYVGVYGFLAYLVHTWVRPAVLRRTIVGFLLGMIALVGPSRIYLGHHWATDVSASYLLGTTYLIGLTSLYRRVKARATGVSRP